MLSLIVFVIVLSVLVLAHELGHFAVSKAIGVAVEKFSIGFGPKICAVKFRGTEYVLSAVPLGGYVKLAGEEPEKGRKYERREYLSRSVRERACILFSGSLVNYTAAFLLFSFIYMAGNPTATTEVGSLLPDYPAALAGLSLGDRVVAIDGKAVRYWDDLTKIVRVKLDGVLKLTVRRGGGTFNVDVSPRIRSSRDIFGNETKVALLGIMPSETIESVRYGFFKSFGMGARKLLQITEVTYKAIWSLLTGRMSIKDSMTGPLGIFVITGKAAHLGLLHVLNLMGVLSASLAIFNLLPIPVLDGGHIFFLALEKARGRPLTPKSQEVITNAGVALLALLMVYVFYVDLVRFQVVDRAVRVFRR